MSKNLRKSSQKRSDHYNLKPTFAKIEEEDDIDHEQIAEKAISLQSIKEKHHKTVASPPTEKDSQKNLFNNFSNLDSQICNDARIDPRNFDKSGGNTFYGTLGSQR